MNRIWTIVFILSCSVLLFVGPDLVLTSCSVGANRAVKVGLELCAIYAVWTGIMKILEETGASKWIAKGMSPIINLVFGKDLSPEAKKYISLNISANFLGMSGAATPMGIKSIEAMDDGSERATRGMKMLVVLSATGLQFISTTVIGLLTQSGNNNPTSVILPSLIAGVCSTMIGIILVSVCEKIKKKFSKKKTVELPHIEKQKFGGSL